jgi:hypothetical protein
VRFLASEFVTNEDGRIDTLGIDENNAPVTLAARPPVSRCQSLSFSPLAAVNDTFFEAAIVITSPVAGLRPCRSGRSLTANLPKPGIDTSSPFAAALAI